MKSVIIRDSFGVVLLHIKRTRNGVESKALEALKGIEIKVLLHDKSIIVLKPGAKKQKEVSQ